MGSAQRKPKLFEEQASDSERLRAKSRKLLIDFAATDLDIAHTFIELARSAFQAGETEHASRLLGKAERAAEVVGGLIGRVSKNAAVALQSRLDALNQAIHEMKGQAP